MNINNINDLVSNFADIVCSHGGFCSYIGESSQTAYLKDLYENAKNLIKEIELEKKKCKRPKFNVGEKVFFAGSNYSVNEKKVKSYSLSKDSDGNEYYLYFFGEVFGPTFLVAAEWEIFRSKNEVIDYKINKWRNAT